MDGNNIILDLCSGTGSWSLPYRQAGYDVIPVDIQSGDDVRLFKPPMKNVIGVICAPPCTDLASSGALYWERKGEKSLLEALSIVDACLRIVIVSKPEWWALENPIGRLRNYLGKPKLIFNPCDYGDAYTKKTCLWGSFTIPEKNPVAPIKAPNSGHHNQDYYLNHFVGKSLTKKERASIRSETPPGFAKAFFEANR